MIELRCANCKPLRIQYIAIIKIKMPKGNGKLPPPRLEILET
jgi:hypothetical protein